MSSPEVRTEDKLNGANAKLAQLDQLLSDAKRMLIVLHDNPDPDALASAAALGYIAKRRCGVNSTIGYGGIIGRAENRAMVRVLKIPAKAISRLRFGSYDRIALLDTQPGAGNNSLPEEVPADIVIDHHPPRRGVKVPFAVVDPNYGATATILAEWLFASGLDLSGDLATALAYAISSETQDLGREAGERDNRVYLSVYPKASMRKLSRIIHANLPRSYFVTLAKALYKTMSFRHLICAHLGDVPSPEIVPEIADFLVRHERIGWSMCTGRFDGNLIISLRTNNPRARAGRLLQRLIANRGRAGGHDMMAGGRIPLKKNQDGSPESLEEQLAREFARLLGYGEVKWRPLFEATQPA